MADNLGQEIIKDKAQQIYDGLSDEWKEIDYRSKRSDSNDPCRIIVFEGLEEETINFLDAFFDFNFYEDAPDFIERVYRMLTNTCNCGNDKEYVVMHDYRAFTIAQKRTEEEYHLSLEAIAAYYFNMNHLLDLNDLRCKTIQYQMDFYIMRQFSKCINEHLIKKFGFEGNKITTNPIKYK